MRTLALIALGLVIAAGSALAAPGSATLTIRHQMRGCHSWSFDGHTWRAAQAVTLSRHGKLTVIDNDVMPHTLVQLAGPRASVRGAAMRHPGATANLTFAQPGRYVFVTKAGEDYMKGVKTIGEDNVLRLVVTVK
jgi:hypothetical protein